MKRILVTGGLGFIGSHLVDCLIEEGCYIHIVDDASSSVVTPYSYGNDYPWSRCSTSLTLLDVAGYVHTPQLHNKYRFDEIYHLASPVGPAGVLEYAGRMAKIIIDDAYAICWLARAHGARLVFVSTSEIYGGGEDGLCREDMRRIIPPRTSVRLEYALGKLAAETALINTCRTTDLKASIVRPFNVAGPRQGAKGGFVVPRFVEQALTGVPLTVFGSGGQVRAFTHVLDIIDGIIAACRLGRGDGDAYNLGNLDNKTTILSLAERVIHLVGQGGQIVHTDGKAIHGPRFEEAADKYPDPTRAINKLGWKPTRSLDTIIQDTIAHLRSIEKA